MAHDLQATGFYKKGDIACILGGSLGQNVVAPSKTGLEFVALRS